ncbi:MAG: 30S ribosomal protein S10 [Nanoarchaeota archaeon]|nr:30S ribosomal protein S10 [Nanoarchaeota archaeon]
MPTARIRLSSTSPEQLNSIISQIIEIAERNKVKYSGPIPLPTQRLKVPVRTSPDGRGRELFETWEMRIHKRVLDLDVDERALRLIMRIPMPKDVNVEIEIIE